MSVQPVELSKAYRLLQVGSTTMISAKYNGVENVMSAAWVGLAGERKVVAYIGPQAFTRQLVEKSGYFVVQIPVVSQMATVLYAGRTSCGPFTMSQAGSSMPSAKAANSIMDRVRTDPPRS